MQQRNLNQVANRIDTASRREILQSPDMIQKTNSIRFPVIPDGDRIFAVVDVGAGDGLYLCREQILDATAFTGLVRMSAAFIDKYPAYAAGTSYNKDDYVWESGYGVFKSLASGNINHTPHSNVAYWLFIESDTVLNIIESKIFYGTYQRMLVVGDKLSTSKMTDDEGNIRLIGRSLSPPLRRAQVISTPGVDNHFHASLYSPVDGNLIGSGLGYNLSVSLWGHTLNSELPRIASGSEVGIYYQPESIYGCWHCSTIFQPSEDWQVGS